MLMYFAEHFIHQAFETDYTKGVLFDKSRQSVCSARITIKTFLINFRVSKLLI